MFPGEFFKGQLALSMDPNIVQYIAMDPNAKVILFGDSTGSETLFSMYPNIIHGSILMPDYFTMAKDVDDDYSGFTEEYVKYLRSEGPFTMIITILKAMRQGRNIVLFVPPQAEGLRYYKVFYRFMQLDFGITMSDGRNVYQSNPAFYPFIASWMYILNMLTLQEFLSYCNSNFIPACVEKAMYDLKIPSRHMMDRVRFDRMCRYLTEYSNHMIMAGKYLTKPFVMEV